MDEELMAIARLIEDEQQHGDYYDSVLQGVDLINTSSRQMSPHRPKHPDPLRDVYTQQQGLYQSAVSISPPRYSEAHDCLPSLVRTVSPYRMMPRYHHHHHHQGVVPVSVSSNITSTEVNENDQKLLPKEIDVATPGSPGDDFERQVQSPTPQCDSFKTATGESQSKLITAIPGSSPTRVVHSPNNRRSTKRHSKSPSIKRDKSLDMSELPQSPSHSRARSASLQTSRRRSRKSASRSQSLATQNDRHYYSPIRNRKSKSCCRYPRCSVGSPGSGQLTSSDQLDTLFTLRDDFIQPASPTSPETSVVLEQSASSVTVSVSSTTTAMDEMEELPHYEPPLPQPAVPSRDFLSVLSDGLVDRRISPTRSRTLENSGTPVLVTIIQEEEEEEEEEPIQEQLEEVHVETLSQSVQTDVVDEPKVEDPSESITIQLLRSSGVVEQFHQDSRNKIIELEYCRRFELVSRFSSDRHLSEQLQLTTAAESAGRNIINQLQHAISREHYNNFKKIAFSKFQSLAVTIHCEDRSRKDIFNYEFLLRSALLHIFKKGCRATFLQEHLQKVNDITSRESHDRLRIMLKLKRYTEWLIKLSVHITHEEVTNRNHISEEESCYRDMLASHQKQSESKIKSLRISIGYVIRDEMSLRGQIFSRHNSKITNIAEQWNTSLCIIRMLKSKLHDLQIYECNARTSLSNEWFDSLHVILSSSILEDYHRVGSSLLFKASLESAELLKYLYALNFWTNSQLDKMMIFEDGENEKRREVMSSEEDERNDITQLMSQFSQRFNDGHNRCLEISEESRSRRSLEWHEVALRNAVVQYHVDSLAEIAVAAKHRQLSKNLELDAIGHGQVPFSPEPQNVNPIRDIDGLVLRLGSVATQLRDRVRSPSSDVVVPVPVLSPVKSQKSPFRIIQELAALYPKGTKILTQTLTSRINAILSQGYVTREDELHLSTLSASIIEQQPDSSMAGRSLTKVFILLNLLIDV